MRMTGLLAGRTVYITGASSGLGAEGARALAREGARVGLGARRSGEIEALAAELRKGGAVAAAAPLDVTDETSVIAWFDALEAAIGPAQSLVNNAGMNMRGLAVDLPVKDFDQVFAVNVRGVFLCAREAARRMMRDGAREAGFGRIVNIASIAGQVVQPGLAAYCSSKAGVIMLTKSLAREWARQGINVNAICPGYIETEINSAWLGEEGGRKMVQAFPRRRVMPIDALASMTIHLAGDASAYVSGGVFVVDDGQSL
jgi:NAD(P)-dependent dehydrogenase (short-subunit alcohol dehydrogenase family)